ncbi:glycosyltransferase family 2 protein [Halomicroarcula limicola]|uniref:Glycosyltransferase family 2 protein n=1 Tax=Haloarcula limicola TaxID=1429915 RepID=A0A8J7YBK4_9EURY|nr:glycosyltransferase family 2 protein [Halomicroarcula limicola]MBV0925209.1 glycosyltransferase family 2 protein [Halomicroarcula limicola]
MSKVGEINIDGNLTVSTNNPAVGIVATEGAAESIAAEIINARRNGHQAIIVGTDGGNQEWRVFARALGARIVDCNALFDQQSMKECLLETAREAGFPGLVFHDDPTSRIDLEASMNVLQESDSFLVDSRSKPPLERGERVLVGIPAYNEEATIGNVVKEGLEYADEVLVVDDGSEDRTAVKAKQAGAIVVEHETNRGYGATLHSLFEQAERACVSHLVVLDADGQHDPSDIPKLVEFQAKSQSEIVIGSRFVGDGETNAPYYRKLGLLVINFLTNLSFGAIRPKSWVKDTQCGFRVYSPRAFENLANDPGIGSQMSASTDILHHAHERNYDIVEVGTNVNYDNENTSSHHPISHGITLVSNILRTIERERPITALGLPGFLCWFGGLAFTYWTITNYTSTNTFPIGLGIVSGFLGLSGILFCFAAVILHSLQQQSGIR